MRVLAAFALAAVLTASAAEAQTPTEAQQAQPGARVAIESSVEDVRVGDVGPRGASVGDTRSELLFLWNRAITHRPIGNAYLLCTTLGSRGVYGRAHVRMCQGVYTLPRGKLIVIGVRRATRFYSFAITGGTRLYRNATGHLTVRPSGPRFLETTFSLD